MPEQGDKKIYIGDIWADKDKSEYQKKFIEDILNTYQGEGKGFNADMLDGLHATEFATKKQGDKADTALQAIQIGRTLITQDNSEVDISTDAIDLESTTKDKENIPWDKWYGTEYAYPDIDREEYTPESLTKAIEYLFKLLQNGIDKVNTDKVDKAKVVINNIVAQDDQGNDRWKVLSDNNFTDEDKALLQSITGSAVELNCYNCSTGVVEGTKTAINADTINGLQFILVTKSIYNNLSADCKSNWRNIFIFVDEIPPDYDSPLNCSFTNGFEFKVETIDSTDYIVYKNKEATQWMRFISLGELYTKFSDDLHSTILTTINNNGQNISETINNLITKNTVNRLIKENDDISIDDAVSWPFIPTILADDYVYDIYATKNGSRISFEKNMISQNGYSFKTIDLAPIYTAIDLSINELDLKTIDSINDATTDLSDRISALEKPDGETKLAERLDHIDTNIHNSEQNINNINTILNPLPEKIRLLENRVSVLESLKSETDMIHIMVGRWTARNTLNQNVTDTISRIVMNVYDAGAAAQYGEADNNPDGIYIRVNNNLDPTKELSDEILNNIAIKLSIKATGGDAIQAGEWWYTFSDTLGQKFGNKAKTINRGVLTDNRSQKYYMSPKMAIRWAETNDPNKPAIYLIEATPYCNGKICGNILTMKLQVEKPASQ